MAMPNLRMYMIHHQQDDGEASDTLQKAYRGPYRIISQGTNSYLLEGGNASEDWVAIKHIKLFHVPM